MIALHDSKEPTKVFASFSEAMREGAKLRPQTRINSWDEIGTCATGAGLHAMYLGNYWTEIGLVSTFEDQMLEIYPYMNTKVLCPVRRLRWWRLFNPTSLSCLGGHRDSLVKQCQHLNDFHKWTREKIADFLEVEEEKLGFVTVSDEEFGSTNKPSCGIQNEESPSQAREKVLV